MLLGIAEFGRSHSNQKMLFTKTSDAPTNIQVNTQRSAALATKIGCFY
ncbi:hypothetical protein IQ252_14635 [Tychonema sp. LEGE 07203]|nr:hypothetical protein [Tychonema sp. LEGE 07203]